MNISWLNPYLLLLIPAFTYLLSYIYLSLYHRQLFIFNTVIHEGGVYTLLQTIFYSSHFLGHMPVHTVLALLFVGVYLSLGKFAVKKDAVKKMLIISLLLLIFIATAFYLSYKEFGYEDTLSFLAQQKQAVNIYEDGGSWNLHLPSTMIFFAFIPVYIYFIKRIFKRDIFINRGGYFYIAAGVVSFFLFTVIINKDVSEAFYKVWTDPRYLAHSVREVATFPITYFPIPLSIMLLYEKRESSLKQADIPVALTYFIGILASVFLLTMLYQAYVPLTIGIGSLAQKPAFASGGKLSVPYLLASHYFEHFLDTVYFTLLCLLLYFASAVSGRERVIRPG
ncbi:MAG: hypothetical protein Q7U10_05765 [Thermodesulfovibrionia bacterium]|nr:hypothetical protein [Thermodesulfovibrionia bacterium]